MSDTEITERQQYWLDHIRAAEAHEESIAAYARAEGLTPKELYQWKTILTRRGLLAGKKVSQDFVQVMGPPRSVPSASASLVLPNGVRLEFHGEFGVDQVGALVSAASALS